MASLGTKAPTDVAAPPADATITSSGLAYRVLEKGNGNRHPARTSVVEVHYSGWTTDGELFDSSVARGRSATFPLDGVIDGWTEGLQLMVEGEQARFWIPGKLAYGDKPSSPDVPAGTLVFDVQLLAIKK
jgi:peptidylprolyl isomerase